MKIIILYMNGWVIITILQPSPISFHWIMLELCDSYFQTLMIEQEIQNYASSSKLT